MKGAVTLVALLIALFSSAPRGDAQQTTLVVTGYGGRWSEVMKKALLPFYTSKPAGSGLGLPLCREIVEAHGGHLRLERREGRGTAVVFWLPGE